MEQAELTQIQAELRTTGSYKDLDLDRFLENNLWGYVELHEDPASGEWRLAATRHVKDVQVGEVKESGDNRLEVTLNVNIIVQMWQDDDAKVPKLALRHNGLPTGLDFPEITVVVDLVFHRDTGEPRTWHWTELSGTMGKLRWLRPPAPA